LKYPPCLNKPRPIYNGKNGLVQLLYMLWQFTDSLWSNGSFRFGKRTPRVTYAWTNRVSRRNWW
jgi:hypothetical protein